MAARMTGSAAITPSRYDSLPLHCSLFAHPVVLVRWSRERQSGLTLEPCVMFVQANDTDVTPEEMEAWRMKRSRGDDPLANGKGTDGYDLV